uniref:PIG-L family deacetylase n=1 Tax=Nonomuraea lactucae TaxID=2249762 RepID=UPI000DE26C51
PSAWDRLCGFGSAAEAARERRAEDARACAALGVEQVALGHPDAPTGGARLTFLEEFLSEYGVSATRVLVPMGIGNTDHLEVRDQALEVLEKSGAAAAPWIYADLPYASAVRQWGTGAAAEALAEHPRLGAPIRSLACSAVPRQAGRLEGPAWAAKRCAVLCYASQLAPLASDYGEILAVPGPLTHELIWETSPVGR